MCVESEYCVCVCVRVACVRVCVFERDSVCVWFISKDFILGKSLMILEG